MAKRRKRKTDLGLLPRNYRQTTRWKIDYDYLAKLSPEERLWLARFSDCWYGADYSGQGHDWTRDERAEISRNRHAEECDVYTLAATVDRVTFGIQDDRTADPDEFDATSPPAYLDSDDYKAARDEYRRHLTKQRKHQYPQDTPAYRRAQRKLQTVTPNLDAEPDDGQTKN